MIKSKKQMFIVIGVFTLVMLVGTVTYAFFNYTRTGTANTIRTGRISFTTSQETISLTNAFPITSTDALTDTDNVGEATITITGDTEYSGGIEYLITAEDVTNTIGNKNVPISLIVTPEKTGDLGTEETISNYWTQRGSTTSNYVKLPSDNIADNGRILAGYIAPGETGVNGTIGIKAYLDKDKIAISDTYTNSYSEKTYYAINDNLTENQLNECVSYLSSLGATEAFCQGTGTITRYGSVYTFQEALDSVYIINSTQINNLIAAGIIRELYTDGTTNGWTNQRAVLTTEEWNSLQENPISFKVKVEANENVWVPSKLLEGNVMHEPADYGMKFYIENNGYRLETTVALETDTDTSSFSGEERVVVGEAILSKINSTTGQYEASDESEIDIFIAHFNGNCVPENKQNVEFYDQYKFLSIFESFPPSEILCLIEN